MFPLNKFWKCSTWITLNRKHAEIIASDPDLTSHMRCYAPDEHYSVCKLALADVDLEKESTGFDSTFVDWSRSEVGGHPYTFRTINEADLKLLIERKNLFARRFAKECGLINYWDYITENH